LNLRICFFLFLNDDRDVVRLYLCFVMISVECDRWVDIDESYLFIIVAFLCLFVFEWRVSGIDAIPRDAEIRHR
jgi:hypothetical protein